MPNKLEKIIKGAKKVGRGFLSALIIYNIAPNIDLLNQKNAYAQESIPVVTENHDKGKKRIDYNFRTQVGTISIYEKGLQEGNKVLFNFIGSATLHCEKLDWKLEGKYSVMGEPLDEDRELPTHGVFIKFGSSYPIELGNFIIYPYANVGYNHWTRESNLKFEDSFNKLEFISGDLGIGMKHKYFFVEVDALLPLYSKTDKDQNPSGKIGFNATIGFPIWKNIEAGFQYTRASFEQDKGQPELDIKSYGGFVGINF